MLCGSLCLDLCKMTNNQNDSIVISEQAVQRGLGLSLSYHTRRFDVQRCIPDWYIRNATPHPPYRLFTMHPDIPGGLGVLLPGSAVRNGSPMLAAHIPSTTTSTSNTGGDPILRCALADDVGLVNLRCWTLC